jgi:hypothetical protein
VAAEAGISRAIEHLGMPGPAASNRLDYLFDRRERSVEEIKRHLGADEEAGAEIVSRQVQPERPALQRFRMSSASSKERMFAFPRGLGGGYVHGLRSLTAGAQGTRSLSLLLLVVSAYLIKAFHPKIIPHL